MFIVGSVPLIIVMKYVNEDSRPKYPNFLDTFLAFGFGAISAAIVVCSALTLASVIVPKAWDKYEPSLLLGRLDKKPIEFYQFVEQAFFGISDKNETHTRLPTLEKDDADNFDKYWK